MFEVFFAIRSSLLLTSIVFIQTEQVPSSDTDEDSDEDLEAIWPEQEYTGTYYQP